MGRLLTPAILLLLAEKASHGYELADRYQKLGLTEADSDAGAIYRTLKSLEKKGFVEFSWETRSQGPAKKVYHITPEGKNHLGGWAQEIGFRREKLDRFLDRVKKLTPDLKQ